jgi:hypothetical protein
VCVVILGSLVNKKLSFPTWLRGVTGKETRYVGLYIALGDQQLVTGRALLIGRMFKFEFFDWPSE